MRLGIALATVILLTVLEFGALPGCAAPAETSVLTLENGIRVVVVHFPGSENASIFTYLPMGLASDGDGQTQWSHLLEHLVLRSTIPAQSQQGNGETLADHMRLDFYGTTENWQEGLSHHARWLEGLPFTQASLVAEKPVIYMECDSVVRSLATHKFAFAAWAQGYRFGRTHAAVKADVDRADVSEAQRYRDERLVVLDKTVVCVVGGLDAETVLPVVTQRLGKISSDATLPAPVEAPGGSSRMTWDFEAHHVVFTWPMPDVTEEDYPALMVAGYWLTMQLATDQQLKPLVGTALAGVDLVTPEGRFFYVSVSLRSQASLDAAWQRISEHLGVLRADATSLAEAPLIGQGVASSLTTIPDLEQLKPQLPPNVPLSMAEGNIGLQFAMQEYRYGSHRTAVAQSLSAVTAEQVQQAAGEYLAPEKGATCVLRPGYGP